MSVRRDFSFRFERLQPPKSPILGDFEPEILAQSPPILGDLGSSPEFAVVVNHFCRTDVNPTRCDRDSIPSTSSISASLGASFYSLRDSAAHALVRPIQMSS